MAFKEKLYAKGVEIEIYTQDFKNEFISLTDIAKYKNDDVLVMLFRTG